MTQRDTMIQSVCAFVLVLCLGASGVLSTNIASEAGRSQLVYADRATEGDPPVVAYGVAMGAFRGLFVNYLWLRANRLKEDGKYHEAIQLSDAITKLQPRFPRVWSFHAWNMAYNISVATGNADERWEWVQAGIELLRDDALRYNPNSVLLHKELAWIFIHKVQGVMDDAHRFYKRELAKEWTIVLGEPPDLPREPEAAIEAMAARLRPIIEAPGTVERLIERERETLREGMTEEELAANPEPPTKIGELIAKIEAIEGFSLDKSLLRIVALHEALRQSWYAQNFDLYPRALQEQEELVALLDDPEYADAWERLIPHVRKRVLADTYKMEPLLMLQYTERYGPLDWRHPAAHAIYWASLGVEEGLGRRSTTERTYVNTDRIIVHALQELWRSGTIMYDFLSDRGEASDPSYLAMYNLHYTNAYGRVLEELIRPRAGAVDDEDRAYRLYSAGYENFLREVIRLYYRLGYESIAQAYKDELASSEWLNTNDFIKLDEIAHLSLNEFVENQLIEDRLDIPYVARTEITASLRDGILRGLLQGDRERFEAAYDYAKRVHDKFKERQDERTLADRERDRMEELPRDTRDVTAGVFFRLITSGQVSPFRASRAFRTVPSGIQVRVYDPLASFFSRRGMNKELFDELFPEPVGLEQYRQFLRQQENIKEDVDIERSS